MTRRAFLSSRVIQRQGKFDFKWRVKNWCKWVRKMKIAQNPWIRFTPEQFSRLAKVNSCPGKYSLCLYMRFRKICTEERVRAWPRKWPRFRIAYLKIEANRILSALPGAQRLERRFAHEALFQVTRRAFLALRVIRLTGEFDFLSVSKRM